MSVRLLRCRGVLDQLEQERDTGRELAGGALEGGVGLRTRIALARRVGNAPVDEIGPVGKLGTDLADAVAETDDAGKGLPSELVEVLRAPAGDVDAVLAHGAHRIGVQR